MNITRSGFVLHLPHVLENLRATAAACKSPAHLTFVDNAITAFEENGPDATPDLDGCPLPTARLIFEEVTEAYITASTALRVQERGSFLACDVQLP
ncbi:hypothetical protein [Streptomyces sp. NPDC056304]|uniref:hypothetical protein n=1 Tax=Streptomyces sp. NPDC056304 TaxID=3345778 RepID=UPI0035DF369C